LKRSKDSPAEMMECEQRNIDISQINEENRKFLITTKKDIDDLVLSIRHLGFINAPVVLPRHDQYIIVCGFKRIEAARFLGLTHIPARVLPSDTSQQQCARLCIADNAFQRPFNLIEISRAFALLQKFFRGPEAALQEASLMGLPSNMDYLKKVAPLCQMPSFIQNAVLSDLISISTVWQLSQMPEKEAAAFVDIFSALNCSLNKQREIITLTKEISIRDDITVFEVLMEHSFQKIVYDDSLDSNQKTRQFRNHLRRLRYPHITEAENNFSTQTKKMGLSERFRLIPPQDFEGDTYRLIMDFKNLDEFKAHREKLDELVARPEFTTIFYPRLRITGNSP
jgi:hypothetical protein